MGEVVVSDDGRYCRVIKFYVHIAPGSEWGYFKPPKPREPQRILTPLSFKREAKPEGLLFWTGMSMATPSEAASVILLAWGHEH